jgi:NAD(P)-dependent dehydrogenase (short-subunit alcohol dehydrogenase family)
MEYVSLEISLNGETALVTGAADGIGLAVAQTLSAAGAQIIAIDQNDELLKEANLPPSAKRITWDVGKDTEGLLEAIRAQSELCTILFNNIGIMDGRSFLELPMAAVRHALDVNIVSQWMLTRFVVDGLLAAERPGAIVFNLSLHTSRVRMCPDYSVTKAGLLMLVQEMASELAQWGIRVNSVSPGAIDTWSDRSDRLREHRERSNDVVPMGRLGEPSEVASIVAFLCDATLSGYMTGSNVVIDGGLNQYNWLNHLYRDAADERSQTID